MAAAPLTTALFLLVAVSHCLQMATRKASVSSPKFGSSMNVPSNLEELKGLKMTDKRDADENERSNKFSVSKTATQDAQRHALRHNAPKEETRTVPAGCLVDPTYINEGAVEKKRTNSWQHPMIIEYECDQEGEEKYKYVAGTTEALCDTEGKWTLPAMICVPTTCYLPGSHGPAMYAGDTSVLGNGVPCQEWKENKPHATRHKQFNSRFPFDESLDAASNKCRDPDGDGRPWCYTSDWETRWAHCHVEECKIATRCGFPPFITGTQPVKTEVEDQKVTVTYTCHKTLSYVTGDKTATCDLSKGTWTGPDMFCASQDCFYYGMNKHAVYRGNVNKTISGRSCQSVESQEPHHHHNKITTKLYASLVEIGNRCMDDVGSHEGVPWCYTMDKKKRWEECAIPECNLQGYP